MIERNRNLSKSARHDQSRGWTKSFGVGLFMIPVLLIAACDSLLEVELPGSLRDQDLNQPRLAEVLVRSAQADFDCALSTYVWAGGLWGNDLYHTANFSRGRLTQLRSDEVLIFDQDECDEFTFPQIYLPFQIARRQAEDAVSRIESFPAEAVPNRDFLLGKAHAYAGYAYQILGETMCELAFDGGPIASREAAWALASERFTSALQFVGSATSGEARAIRNLALVGRARSALNLGDDSGVLQDAGGVDEGFMYFAEMDGSDDRRQNQTHDRVNRGDDVVHPSYTNLEIDGVPDPRVPVEFQPDVIPFDAVSQVWWQFKYPDLGADIPFSSWREAQLMIAEVSGGQTAVNVINALRETVDDLPWVTEGPHDLPQFASNDEVEIQAQVWEERRRELFLQGTKIGDILRVDIPGVTTDEFETGVNQRGASYGPNTCYPLPDQETL